MPTPYARLDPGHLIAALRKDGSQWDAAQRSALVTALELMLADIQKIIVDQGKTTFPLYAPDGSPIEPSYSFIDQPFLGLSRNPLYGLYIQNRQRGPAGALPQRAVTIEFATVSGGPDPIGLFVFLDPNYVGSGPTIGQRVDNQVAGTQAWSQSGLTGNIAIEGLAYAATAGCNTGIVGYAENTTGRAVGVWGAVPFDVGTQSIGVGGVGSSDGKGIGGYFTIRPGTNAPPAIQACLVSDNPANYGLDSFICRVNGSNVFVIDQNGHSHEPLSRKVVTTKFDKVNTTLADITNLTALLRAGRTYKFRAVLFVDADAVGGHKYAVSSTTAVTSIIYQINSIDNTALAFKLASRQTGSGGAAGEASGTTYETVIEGVIVVNTATTLSIQFAQNAASGTSSVLVGSTLVIEDMGA